MKVESTTWPGWPGYPVYRVTNCRDYLKISDWMYQNNVDYIDLSAGSSGYIFQVRDNIEWFALKWQ